MQTAQDQVALVYGELRDRAVHRTAIGWSGRHLPAAAVQQNIPVTSQRVPPENLDGVNHLHTRFTGALGEALDGW
jgi:hypothetical protein